MKGLRGPVRLCGPPTRRPARFRLAPLALAWLLAVAFSADGAPPIADVFAERLDGVARETPAITVSAAAAAERLLAHPDALLNIPYWVQPGFSEELLNRAGGLAHALPTLARPRRVTSNDVVVLAVRSWEDDAERVTGAIEDYRSKGWSVTLIASSAGRPPDLPVDFFIENGAPSGARAHGPVNALVNVAIGWMWCCEYTAAMTRRGKLPGILLSIALEGADEWDRALQTPDGRHTVFACDEAVRAGRLAGEYVARVRRMLDDLASETMQASLDRAAGVVADRIRSGGKVGVSGLGHLIIFETIAKDLAAPWHGFQAVNLHKRAFNQNLDPGDLLVWISYIGMNSSYVDFGQYIDEAGLDLVTSYAPLPPLEDGRMASGHRIAEGWYRARPGRTRAHVEQAWTLPDAEVAIPGDPGWMAPVSGLHAVLVLRMLDEAIAARLPPPVADSPEPVSDQP